MADIRRLFDTARPTIVIHFVAIEGGLGANHAKQGNFVYDNAAMGILLIEFSRQYGMQNFVGFGTICAYPKFTPVSLKEDDLWSGHPEETNAPRHTGWPRR